MQSVPDTHAVIDGALRVLCFCAHFPKACGYKPIDAFNHAVKLQAGPVKPSKQKYFWNALLLSTRGCYFIQAERQQKKLHRRSKICREQKVRAVAVLVVTPNLKYIA